MSRRFYIVPLLLACAWLFPSSAAAQQGQTSMGTDFWIGFMPNYLNPASFLQIFIGTGTANEVNVDVYGGVDPPVEHHHMTMTANTIWTLNAKSTITWETRTTEDPEYRAIHVYSKNPIVLYGLSNTYTTTDSYLGLPTNGLGTDYYSVNYYDDMYTLSGPAAGLLAGEFLIVAPYDNTRVTIGPVKTDTRAATPPTNPDGTTILHHQGDTWTVTLMKGQTYLVQSTGTVYGDADLTGTHIVSDKPISLLSGHVRASVPIGELANQNGSKNHLIEMIPSDDKWGTEYYDMPMAGRTACGDLIRVIAGQDNEVITATNANGSYTHTLTHAGDFYDFEEVLDPTVFTSNGRRFLAVLYSYSQGYDGDPGNADPFIIVLTPQQQFQKKLIFRTPDNQAGGAYTHYATFVCRTDSILKIQINGLPITAYPDVGEQPIPGSNPPMTARRIQLSGANITYIATCGSPFGCYLYGFSYADGYGHPAGMALGTVSPDTLPPLQVKDSECGNFQVQLQELRRFPTFSFDDTKIADIAMITDTLDPRWPLPSHNYSFQIDPAHPFMPGDSIAFFDLTVIDPSQDAYAAVWTTDKAGNDTVYQYYYSAPKIASYPGSPFVLKPVRVTADSCQQLIFTNTQSGALQISGATILGSDSSGTFTVTPASINRTLQPNDTLQLQLCFTPTDTLIMNDTLAIGVGCSTFKYPLVGLGVTPLIVASDVDFGNVTVGTTSAPRLVTVKNVGTAALTLDKNWKLDDNADFQFADQSQLPVTLAPGQIAKLNFTFSPQATGPYSTLQHWGTDLPTPFAHEIKDTSLLTGIGVQAGLNWDRSKQRFTTECSNPVIDTVYLKNPSSGSEGTDIEVSNIQITGPDAAEFSVVGMQFTMGSPWLLKKDSSVWVALQFTPDLTKQYAVRSATITATGTSGLETFNPSIALTGTVRHSTIRITPPNYNFGTVQPGDSVGTTFWIHNDGDTVLVLSGLTVNGGFSLAGYTPNEQILPGDSAMVVVSDASVPAGTSAVILTASGPSPCTDTGSSTIGGKAVSFAAVGTGHDFGNMYVCQNGSAQVSTSNDGSIDGELMTVSIIDTDGSTGASQFTFGNGSQSMTLDTTLHPGESVSFTLLYDPQIAGGPTAYIRYIWRDPQTGGDSVYLYQLSGNPLHYINTMSVASGAAGGVYTAYPAQQVNVPVSFVSKIGGFDQNSGIYGVRVILRYRRDMFVPSAWQDDDLHVERSDTGTDPTDPNYVVDTVTLSSNVPITQGDSVLAHLPLEYVVNKDSVSSLDIIDPIYLDSAMQPACWVSHDTIPATFAGLDRCGDATLRSFLSGGTPTFRIQSITPNPVNGEANVTYKVQLDGVPLSMDVFDVLGRRQLSLMWNTPIVSGQHRFPLSTASLRSGSYVLRVTDGTTVQSVPFVVQK